MNADELRQLIQGITTAINGNNAALAQAVAAAVTPPAHVAPFARAPGLANPAALIDYTTSVGIKVYQAGVQPLPIPFDIPSGRIVPFMTQLRERARNMGWDSVVTFNDGVVDRNILTQYGIITRAQITAQAAMWISNNDRQAQNNAMLYDCIMNSLTEVSRILIATELQDSMVNDLPCGALLLKIVLNRAILDNQATVDQYR